MSNSLKKNYERHEEQKFLSQLEEDSEFSITDSHLIINGWSILDSIIKKDQKLVNDFNKKLKDRGVNMCIRGIHKTKIRQMVYYYNGLYIFEGFGKKRKYKGKFDPRDWRNILTKEDYDKVGNLPRTHLPDIRFKRVFDGENETDNIIIPTINFFDNRVRNIFSECTVFKLS